MATTTDIHVGDIGTLLKITVSDGSAPIDLSEASNIQIVLKPPSGQTVTKDAELFTDGTDGIITYTTLAGDLSVKGAWQAQVLVTLPTGSWSSSIIKFSVAANLSSGAS